MCHGDTGLPAPVGIPASPWQTLPHSHAPQQILCAQTPSRSSRQLRSKPRAQPGTLRERVIGNEIKEYLMAMWKHLRGRQSL